MNTSLKKQAESIIKTKRERAEKNADSAFLFAMQNGTFKTNNYKLKTEMINISKTIAEGGEPNLETLKILEAERREILQELSLREADLTPHYSCGICRDTGTNKGEPCSCLKAEMSKLLIEKSGLKSLNSFRDSNYTLFDKPKEIQQLYLKMQEWCASKFNKKIILLSGNTGVGKTFLTKAMANELIENGKFVYFSTAFGLNQDMLNYHTTFDETKNRYLENYLEADVLFIDDLGTEVIYKNVTLEYLYLIISERIVKGKPIVITTNLDLKDIRDTYGERISSRLYSKEFSIQINLNNPDLRLK